jgi:predicted exporter
LATALVATLLLLAYRSATALVLTFVPVASGALAGAACVGLVYGSLHGATLGFGATLIGEAVDYAIYFFSHMESGLPPRRTLDRIWPTLRLGVMTSVCGFCGMLFSGFPGLAQLGLFSISGLIVAALVTRGVLPALTPHEFRLRSSDALPRLLMRFFAGLAVFRQILPLALIGVVAWLLMRSGPFWSDELASLSPVPLAEQRLDEELRSALGAPNVRHLIIARGHSMEDALQAAERTGARLDALVPGGALAAYDSPARHLPSAQAQRARQDALPARADLQRNLAAAARKLAYRNSAFEPFLADAEAARSAKALVRDDLRGTTLALKVDSLLVERRGEWFALMPLRGVRDAGAVTQAAGADAVVLDIKDASDALYRNYRMQVVLYSIVGVVIIIGLLLAATRSVRRTLDVLMPLAAAVLVTCAILVAMGIALSLFHLVALLLVVGVGSNYSLFFERENFARGNPVRTVAALVLCATSTMIGFGLLGFAGTPVLSAIGLTVAIGAFLSLIFAAALTARL